MAAANLTAFRPRLMLYENARLSPQVEYLLPLMEESDGDLIFSRHWRWVLVIALWEEFRYGDLLYVPSPILYWLKTC